MVNKREEYYFNGNKILKQTLNKYIAWSSVLAAIKNGANNYESLKERLGKGSGDMLQALKACDMIVGSSNTRTAIYTITKNGEQLIKDVKQYQKEKKDEERRMFRDC